MPIQAQTPVGQLAADHPLATRVFARHGIDFCCGGGQPLAAACEKRGLDPARLVEEIEKELQTSDETPESWSEAPLPDLIEHIVSTYHRALDEELPRLESMARKVVEVHGDKDPERLEELLSTFLALKDELESHMQKEEQVLFPMIREGQGSMADGPVSVMLHEHESAAAALRRIAELTDDHRVPEGACNTWRALWHGLEALEKDLHQHIHLENNILFPRALADH